MYFCFWHRPNVLHTSIVHMSPVCRLILQDRHRNYIETTIFPPSLWTQVPSYALHSTNNGPESFYWHFSAQFTSSHPTFLYIFWNALVKQQTVTCITMHGINTVPRCTCYYCRTQTTTETFPCINQSTVWEPRGCSKACHPYHSHLHPWDAIFIYAVLCKRVPWPLVEKISPIVFFCHIVDPVSCLHSLLPPPRPSAVTSRLRSSHIFPKVHTRTKRYCSFIQYGLNHYQHKIKSLPA